MDIRFISWAGYQLAPCSGGLADDNSFIIWNGIGPHDGGGDWSHTGFGTEDALAKHTGSYGLDASGMRKNDTFAFTGPTNRYTPEADWDFLRLWVNVRSWQNHNKDMYVKWYGSHEESNNPGGYHTTYLILNDYLSITQIGGWQKVMIPLDDFNFEALNHAAHDGYPFYLHKLEFIADGKMGVWVDDIAFVAGTQDTTTVAVCAPDMTADNVGSPEITGQEMKPGLRCFPQPNMTITDPNASPYPRRYL
jgi:hypothetical protein